MTFMSIRPSSNGYGNAMNAIAIAYLYSYWFCRPRARQFLATLAQWTRMNSWRVKYLEQHWRVFSHTQKRWYTINQIQIQFWHVSIFYQFKLCELKFCLPADAFQQIFAIFFCLPKRVLQSCGQIAKLSYGGTPSRISGICVFDVLELFNISRLQICNKNWLLFRMPTNHSVG